MIVLNETKTKKTKRKAQTRHWGAGQIIVKKNKSKRQKVRKQAQVILSLEIP